ncbi:MAG: PEP-CTERM sorting domain-containing protein [Verrucomicrobia bacterium]|nr:PEP-CTERM sorting domain-containing protein [Verrucomicrobiota bacterium]
MKQILLITTLLAASSATVMAGTARLDMIGGSSNYLDTLNKDASNTGWTYTAVQENVFGQQSGNIWNGQGIIHDGYHTRASLEHKRANMTIELNKDARYEFSFTFTLNQAAATPNGYFAMGGMYLAGSKGSLYFGNSLDSNWDKGAAVIHRYSGNMAGYNDDLGEDIYFPNHDFDTFQTPIDHVDPISGQKWTIVDGNAYNTGTYKLEMVIESFSDSSKDDMVYFYASTPQGTAFQKGDTWTMKSLGFGNDAYFDSYGFVLHDDNGSLATPVQAKGYEYSRVVRATPEPEEPEVLPDIPEPSAFGMLAGLGALALVASRRRRS